eukprot:TRINITY_DN9930_c0_g1_i2.p1 TRINITY_DN9930_c0_g1~~TRINITY_DN9930_c0_g1_i2.p1  ORF type:complete len:154 (-),score=31.27 TRINITY_DN9930_c0_g1_i2:321-782(-)
MSKRSLGAAALARDNMRSPKVSSEGLQRGERASRSRQLSSKVKHMDEFAKKDALMARLEALERDNYTAEDQSTNLIGDDADYVGESEDEEYTKKKRKSRKTEKSKSSKKAITTFANVLEEEKYEAYPRGVATYLSIAAAPSVFPARHFCSVCG